MQGSCKAGRGKVSPLQAELTAPKHCALGSALVCRRTPAFLI